MKLPLQKLLVLGATLVSSVSVQAGVLSIAQFTNDTDSLISSANSYTHAVDLNGDAPLTINGVLFVADDQTGTNYTLFGANTVLDGDATNVTGTVAQALDDFFYTGDNSGN